MQAHHETRRRAIEPLRHRNFALLFTGQTISSLGNFAYSAVLTWTVYAISGSTAATGLVLLAASIPQLLLLLFGGILGDRISRRGIILVADVISGMAIGLAALLAAIGHLNVPVLALLSIIAGTVSAFFLPSYIALTPDVVPEDALQGANGLQGMSLGATQMIGPLLGAALYGWGRAAAAFGFDAVTFFVSAGATLLLRLPARPVSATTPIWEDIRGGWSYVRGSTWVWLTIALASLAVATGIAPLLVLLPAILRHLHLAVGYMGLTLAISGVTGTLANLLLAHLPRLPHRGPIMYLGFALPGIGTLIIGLSSSYVLIAVGAALFGIGWAANSVWQALVQELVPRDYLSRVTSLDYLGSLGLMPVGYALAGALAAMVSPQTVLIAGGSIAASLFLLTACSEPVRKLR